MLDDCKEQIVLGREVIVQVTLADAGSHSYLAHTSTTDLLFRNYCKRGIQDRLSLGEAPILSHYITPVVVADSQWVMFLLQVLRA